MNSPGFIKIKRSWAFFLFLGLLVLIIVNQSEIFLLKKSQVNYISTFHRPIMVPNTFAIDTLYSKTHKEIRIFGPKGKGVIYIGHDFSSMPGFMDYMNKNAKGNKETKCGIDIIKFTELKTAPTMGNTILQNNEEYILFAGVEEKYVKQAIDSLCISYQN